MLHLDTHCTALFQQSLPPFRLEKFTAAEPLDEPPRLQTLERSYLLRINGQVVERPQHMLMRVALGIWKDDLDQAIRTYQLLSERWCGLCDNCWEVTTHTYV